MWCYSCALHITDNDMIHFILRWCSFVLNISLSENNFDAVSASKKKKTFNERQDQTLLPDSVPYYWS